MFSKSKFKSKFEANQKQINAEKSTKKSAGQSVLSDKEKTNQLIFINLQLKRHVAESRLQIVCVRPIGLR